MTADLIADCLDELRAGGWAQGHFRFEGSRCLVATIEDVVGVELADPLFLVLLPLLDPVGSNLVDDILATLSAAIDPERHAGLTRTELVGLVIGYNDDSGTEWTDIEALLERAAGAEDGGTETPRSTLADDRAA